MLLIMEYISEHVVPHLLSPNFYLFGGCLAISTYLGKKILNKYKEKKSPNLNVNNTLYFGLHFIFNMYCTVYVYPNVISTLNNPLVIKKVPSDLSFYIILFHIYHVILCGKKISTDEIIHHSLVFILCPLLWVCYNNLCDFAIFFMTGLPGGITYLCLFLKNMGAIEGITEKYISKHLNMWIRGPGGVIASYLIYLNYVNNNFGEIYPTKKFAIYLSIFFNLWNGMYFASTIIESYKLNTIDKINKREPYKLSKFTFIVDKFSNLMNRICFSKEMIDNYKQKLSFPTEWIDVYKKKIFKEKNNSDNNINGTPISTPTTSTTTSTISA